MSSRSATATDRSRPRALSGAAPARPGTKAAPQTKARRPTKAQRAARRARTRRRRAVAVVLLGLVAGIAVAISSGVFDTAVKSITLPLRHEDIIGVIYTESHFRDDQTSSAGAEGLMQITPATARDIARKSGGVAFEVDDLATPQVNIAYGAYYLRYLLNRYDGDVPLALAAYNGGEGNVDKWRAASSRKGKDFRTSDIPFTETREYVQKVLDARRSYRAEYRDELGL
jgi:soluble lytic murein transglycosylase